MRGQELIDNYHQKLAALSDLQKRFPQIKYHPIIRGSSLNLINPHRFGFDLTELKAYYKFNESSGNIINKASEVGSSSEIANSDLVTSGVTYIPSGSDSPFGYALSFDGVNDTADASSSALADWKFLNVNNTKWTWCGWLNRDGTTVDDFFATTNFNAGDVGMKCRINAGASNTIICQAGKQGTDQISFTSTHTISSAGWHFLYFSYDDSTGVMIINLDAGTRQTQSGNNLTNTDNPEDIGSFGHDSNIVNLFAGDMVEVSIWGRVLSVSEESDLYNSGNGRQL